MLIIHHFLHGKKVSVKLLLTSEFVLVYTYTRYIKVKLAILFMYMLVCIVAYLNLVTDYRYIFCLVRLFARYKIKLIIYEKVVHEAPCMLYSRAYRV